MVKFVIYDHTMQNHARKIIPCVFLCQHWFLNQKGILLTFLVNILALLTFGQSFDFVDLFSKKCKSEKYHGAKLGYDSCPYLISLNHKNANNPGIRILLVEDN